MSQAELPISDSMLEGSYLARPQSGTGPGVLVLHAWWGLNPFFKSFCDRLAQVGFVAFAPDLYHGAVASTIEEAEKLRSTLKPEIAAAKILQAAHQLQKVCDPSRQSIGVIGFSMGGYWALWLSDQKSSPVSAAIVFYGARSGSYAESQAAYQFHFAEQDHFVPADGIHHLENSLKTAGREAEFFQYPGTSHWFFENDRTAYHQSASEAAWKRIVPFLNNHLK